MNFEDIDLEAVLERLERVEVGCSYGGLHPEDLTHLWTRAHRYGAVKLRLEVWLEEDQYHLAVKVLERSQHSGLARQGTAP